MDSKERYTGKSGETYQSAKRGIPDAALPWVTRSRAAKLQGYVQSQDTVFEYGVGLGWNLGELRCKRRLGHDLGLFLAESVEALGIEFVPDPARLEDETAEVVVCHHTLEHVPDPLEVLAQCLRILRVGGCLLLFVPFEKERRYRHFDPTEPNHHLFSWNAQTLGNLASDAGFELRDVRIGPFGYDRFAAVWAHRMRLGEWGFRWLRRLLLGIRPAQEVRLVATKPKNKVT